MGWLRGTKMATDETAKRSNCNHESNRCHALTTASTLMKRILNRVKWFFKVMQGMSSDRPRAVRYTENDKRGNIFSQEVRYRAAKTGILQSTKTCNNSQAPDLSGPRESTNSNYKNQAARPLKKTNGGNRRAQPSLSSGGMACALTSKNSQSPTSKCSADQRKPARRARLRQPKEPLKGSARRGPSPASVAR